MATCFVCRDKKKQGEKHKIPGLYEVFICNSCVKEGKGL